jgi:hypothetical protein
VRDRLPVTITKVIDHLVRDKDKIVKTPGEVSPTCKKNCTKLKESLGKNKINIY